MAQRFANAARGILASNIVPGTTTIEILEGGNLFPVISGNDWFKAVLQDADGIEIIRVNARTGNVFTVVRGQEGTTARAFSAGTTVGLRITAADVEGSIATANNSVQLTGDQTIGGTKTFSSQIVASGGVQGNVTGNAATATTLQTARTINGVSFNGSANITLPTVNTTGDQSVGGVKTFTSQIVASGGVQGNVTGSAGSVAWTNVTGRPTAVSSFTNDSGYINTGDVARTIVKFASTVVGTRRGLNFLAGSGIRLSLADDPGNEEVDITITSMAPAMTTGYPTIRPSLMLDFANTRTLDPRITFTRASTATFFNQNGVLQTAVVNTPRFDHNPASGESLGLLIEAQRTNLFLRSEEFDNAAWQTSNATVTANTAVAPDGALTADKLQATATNAFHGLNGGAGNSISFTRDTTYTISAFAKAGEYGFLRLGFPVNAFNSESAYFNLQTGALGTRNGGVSHSIVAVGNGWYRCSFTATATATTSGAGSFLYVSQSDNQGSYAGDGTSGIFIWGAQLEVGAFPTSYIPTTTSQVTRAQDFASLSNAGFGDASGALSVLVDAFSFMPVVNFLHSGYFQIGRLTYGKYNFSFGFYSSAPADYFGTLGNFGPDSVFNRRAAFSISSLGYSYVFNGGPVFSSSNTGPLSSVSGGLIHIGRNLEGFNSVLNGHVRELKIYPSALPAAQLQAISNV